MFNGSNIPLRLLRVRAEEARDEALLPAVPLDAAVRHAETRTSGLVVEPFGCDLAEVAWVAVDEDSGVGVLICELLDRRSEELGCEWACLKEGGNVCCCPEWADGR